MWRAPPDPGIIECMSGVGVGSGTLSGGDAGGCDGVRARALAELESRFGDASGIDELLESAIPEWCREQMVAHQRDENAAAARRLLGVRELVDARHAMLLRSGAMKGRARRAAISEVAAASTCTMHMAEVHYDIGELLASHMPTVKGAALAGLIDYAHLVVVQRGGFTGAPGDRRRIGRGHRGLREAACAGRAGEGDRTSSDGT